MRVIVGVHEQFKSEVKVSLKYNTPNYSNHVKGKVENRLPIDPRSSGRNGQRRRETVWPAQILKQQRVSVNLIKYMPCWYGAEKHHQHMRIKRGNNRFKIGTVIQVVVEPRRSELRKLVNM